MSTLGQYHILRHAVRWKFPSSVERLAYAATEAEEFGIAFQVSDNTLWMLVEGPGTWIQISTI